MAAPRIAGLLLVKGGEIDSDIGVSNDADSNFDPIAVSERPLLVSISGPSAMNSGDPGYFDGIGKYGESQNSYQWYYRNTPSDPWIADGTSNNYTHIWNNAGPNDMDAAVANGTETDSHIHSITIAPCSRSGGDSIGTNDVKPC